MKNQSILYYAFLTLILSTTLKVNAQLTNTIPPSDLSRSDVPFSPRWYWPNHLLVNGLINDVSELNGVANSFNANRFLWTYKAGTNSISDLEPHPSVLLPAYALTKEVQYTMPYYIRKQTRIDYPILFDKMVAKNLCGEPLRNIWEIVQNWDGLRPDYNSSEFFNYQIENVKDLVDDGVFSFHQDGASGNETSVDFGGSFNHASMINFRDWLGDVDNISGSELTSLGINQRTFNYKDYLLNYLDTNGLSEKECNCLFSDIKESKNGRTGTVEERLKYYFREFQKQATKDYYDSLHLAVDNYILSKGFKGISKGIYSANNHESNKWISPHFDFWVSELYPKDNNESLMYDITEIARFGRSAFYETDYNIGDVVNSITVARTEVSTNKNSIALSYASGMTMIVPWDVYIAPFNGAQPRFYGDASDYADLLSFIRNKQNLFNGYNTIEEHIYSFLNYYDKVIDKDTIDATKFNIRLLRNSVPKDIPSGSKIKVGENIFTTIGPTTVGNIYLPIGSINLINVGDPVYYLDLNNGNGTYTRYFDDTYRAKRSINDPDVDITSDFAISLDSIGSPAGRFRLNWTGAHSGLVIPTGSRVMAGDIEFQTITETRVGLIYLSESNANSLKSKYLNNISDLPIWYIKGPGGNIIYPTENKPFAINVRSDQNYRTFGVVQAVIQSGNPSNKKTSIGWSEAALVKKIPKGSRVLINDKEYLTQGITGNGTLHLASDKYIPEGSIKPGDDIWYIKDPVGNIIYPKKIINNPVMHIINLSDQPKKVAIKIKHSVNTKFEHLDLFSPNSSSINKHFVSTFSSNIYTIENLEKWAILAKNNRTSTISRTSGTEKIVIDKQFSIYPNPNKGTFTIHFEESPKNSKITIYNSIGANVFTQFNPTKITEINLSNISTGIYFVKIESPKEILTKKIIIE